MICIPDITLRVLMSRVVEACHELCDEAGASHVTPTISEAQMRMAAITAVTIAIGDVAWPMDRKLVLKRPSQRFGIFEVEG